MNKFSIFIITLLLVIAGVGCSDEDIHIPCEVFDACPTPSPSPVVEPTPEPDPIEPTPTPELKNPVCDTRQKFCCGNGNVWKPKSESDGNLVVILESKWVKPWKCETWFKDGGSEVLKFKGFANGNRQHLRGSRPGGQYENGALLICEDGDQFCEFSFKGKAKNRHE